MTLVVSPELEHGGRLRDAARRYGIAQEQWLDLSTGISPWSWPVPPLPDCVWQRLPEENDGLLDNAAAYYGCNPETLVAIPGSQFAICQLPLMAAERRPGRVAMPRIGYQEHALRWEMAGHQLVFYEGATELAALVAGAGVNHAVVINPNNPTAERIDRKVLISLAQTLPGMLVVDEAFMDAYADNSLMGTELANLVILRSVGKFFGLAGLRLGFACAPPPLATGLSNRLSYQLGPWAINHPARWLASQALADSPWQRLQRQRLIDTSQRWRGALAERLPALRFTSSGLFVSAPVTAGQGAALFERAARKGLLLRLVLPYDIPGADEHPGPESPDLERPDLERPDLKYQPAILRFGLPSEQQLDAALYRLETLES